MRSPRRSPLRRIADVARASAILLVAFGGYQAAASDGVQSPSADWIPHISIPDIPLPDVDLPDIIFPGVSEQMWTWRGVSAGHTRTVTIDIDESIYPVDGVEWFHNDAHDRHDLYGPLDEDLGLWHSSTRPLEVGDVITACWQSADGDEHCPTILVR